MAQIVQIIAGDNQLQLGNEQYIRRLSFGYNWTKVRVGIRFAVYGQAPTLPGTAKVSLGLTVNLKEYHDPNADMVFYTYLSNGQWTYNAGPPQYYNGINTSTPGSTNVAGVVNTSTSANSILNMAIMAGANNATSIILADFTRAGSAITVGGVTLSTAQVQSLPSSGLFYYNMECEVSPPSCALVACGTPTYAGSGLFDSVWVNWTSSTPAINISELAVTRFY